MLWRRFELVGLGGVTTAALAGLGLATVRQNVVGWCALLLALGGVAVGAIYLAVTPADRVSQHSAGNRCLWLLAPGCVTVFFGAPLEWLFLPSLLPRGLVDQALGVGLIVAGWWVWLSSVPARDEAPFTRIVVSDR